MRKDKIKLGIRFIVTTLLVILIVYTVDWRDSLRTISKISLTYIILLLLISFFMTGISCFKWQLFLRAKNVFVPLTQLFLLYHVGYFFNMFLPSQVGGDVARSFILGKQIGNKPESFGSVFLERFTGLLGLLVLAVLAFVFNIRFIHKPEIGIFLLFFVIVFVFTVFLLFTEWSQKLLTAILQIGPLKKIENSVAKFLDAIYYFRNQPVVLSKAMLISFLFHVMTVINTLVVCMALGIHTTFLDLATIVPIILLISCIPISFNAIGLFEWSFVYFFSILGITSSLALSIALVLRAKGLLGAIIGGIIFAILNKLPQKQLDTNNVFKGAGT